MSDNQKRARERINREKQADKVKFDRILDRARTMDTRSKNRTTRPNMESFNEFVKGMKDA